MTFRYTIKLIAIIPLLLLGCMESSSVSGDSDILVFTQDDCIVYHSSGAKVGIHSPLSDTAILGSNVSGYWVCYYPDSFTALTCSESYTSDTHSYIKDVGYEYIDSVLYFPTGDIDKGSISCVID